MKDKLTISDLSSYLPYELQMVMQWPNTPHQTGTLKSIGLHPGTGGEDLVTVFVEFEKDNSRQIIYKKNAENPICKPLLIPISEFGAWDEIFMKGLTDSGWEEEIFSLAFEYHSEAVECLIYVNDIKYNCTFSYVNGNLEFNGNIQFNQLAAFNEMFRKHIDLYYLIDKGLAINKLNHA
jgi:hypothetical protein